jgi:hypothetical protein
MRPPAGILDRAAVVNVVIGPQRLGRKHQEPILGTVAALET